MPHMSRDKAFRQLLSQLADPDPHVRADAIVQVEEFPPENPMVVPALIRCLQADPDSWVRACAANTLGTTRPAALDAVPALIQALKDPDSIVREWSANALDFIGPATEEA